MFMVSYHLGPIYRDLVVFRWEQYWDPCHSSYASTTAQTVWTNMRMFADNTKIWREIKGTEDSAELQRDLIRLVEWSDRWLIKLNPEKCKPLRIGHKHETQCGIEQDSTHWKTDPVTEVKDLGGWTSAVLKSSKHCQESLRLGFTTLEKR